MLYHPLKGYSLGVKARLKKIPKERGICVWDKIKGFFTPGYFSFPERPVKVNLTRKDFQLKPVFFSDFPSPFELAFNLTI